jgi:hypothetical protein
MGLLSSVKKFAAAFFCVNSDMNVLQLRYLGSDAVDDCKSGGTAGTRR